MYLQEYQRKLNDSEERNKDLISDTKLLSVRIKTLESQLLDLKVSKCVIIFSLRNEPILIITLLCLPLNCAFHFDYMYIYLAKFRCMKCKL